jgi:heme oxygenase
MLHVNASIQLKQSTNQAHRTLDAHPILRSLVRPNLSEGEYILALVALEHWIKKHMPLFLNHSNDSLKRRVSERYSWLIKDLTALNALDYIIETEPFQTRTVSQAEVFGAVYVFEGASLGGRVLAPLVEKSLNRLDVTRFYNGYSNTFDLWRETQGVLDANLITPKQIEVAINSANQLFSSMGESLDIVSESQFQCDEVANG